MSTRLDAFLVATALVTLGVAGGCVLVTTVGPEPYPTVTTTATATVRVTLPPKVVTKTVRVTERASRSQVRETPRVPASAETSDYQAYARARVESSQWSCLQTLWERESGWNPAAVNGSHAGIPQIKGMARDTGWKWQIERGIAYIGARYDGSACKALAHSDQVSWY